MTRTIISVHTADAQERAQWRDALAQALGESFDVIESPSAQARYAVAWSPAEAFFAEQPKLNAVFSMAAGVDHLLRVGTLPDTLPIYRLEDAGMGAQMVRYCRHEVEHLLLAHDRYNAQQSQAQWLEHPVLEPAELPVGIFGFGVLGKLVASALRAEGYPVSAFRRGNGAAPSDITVYSGADQWSAFLSGIRVLILLAPLTDGTRGVIDEQALSALGPQGWLINVGRGGLIDETALLRALDDGRLLGASLDVFTNEPLPKTHPFWRHPRVRMTPHVAAVTRIAPSAAQIARRIRALESGEDAGHPVDRQAGY